ncbi:FMN-binding glutamate synthase family protein [Roseivirga sp.]|uniref:FMN-binding glutamate synthase family protein n=1 Tax=Roseivirga sp. TaxID=1964215 RepID=UPI003B8B005F
MEFLATIPWWAWVLAILVIIALRDIIQRKHAISHNFPIVGHLRFMLEKIGPELRQYIVANNREELPFNRSQRSWIYASSKKENNYQGFGTDQDQSAPGFIFINPTMIPFKLPKNHLNLKDKSLLPCAKVMGAYNGRKRPFRPQSIVNVSAMSYGSLSAKAIESLNKGAAKANCYHNTGEGSLSKHHQHGSDIVFHFGTGYFGVRDEEGNFSMEKMVNLTKQHDRIRAIEVKLSQGAKPGKGGVLPASKITKEIAEIRHVKMGEDVLSPSSHTAFSNIPEMLDFIESIAHETGLPVGFKSAVGKLEMWEELTDLMIERKTGPDFITIDGGEGGTGAAPPAFANHVALPFNYGFAAVYKIFERKGLCDRVVFVASGKLGFPSSALMAFAMGADVINVAREAMMSIGCIQAQVCHTNTCPAGIATQKRWLQNGIDPTLKSERFANYVKTLRKEILEITHAAGYEHPCQMTMTDVDMSMGDNNFTTTLNKVYDYDKVPVAFNGMSSLN